jgi:hypothetical protein
MDIYYNIEKDSLSRLSDEVVEYIVTIKITAVTTGQLKDELKKAIQDLDQYFV